MKHFGLIILFTLLFFLNAPTVRVIVAKKEIDKKVTPIVVLLDSIKQEINRLGLLYPDVVYAQILHESHGLTSKLFITHNNLFGMKESHSRATTSKIIVDGYKWYPNWKESLMDYALLQMAYYRVNSKQAYYEELQESYASDSLYITKLKNIVKNVSIY